MRSRRSKPSNRAATVLPLLPGTQQRASHDYRRHGITNLYAALDVWPSSRSSDLARDHLGAGERRRAQLSTGVSGSAKKEVPRTGWSGR